MVLQAVLPVYIQLAGGTNDHTVEKLKRSQMLRRFNQDDRVKSVAGVAYGSYARTILLSTLDQLETTELQNIKSNLFKSQSMNELKLKLEQDQALLQQAVSIASQLVNQIKRDV
ncbi:MAG: LdpA C-terminal domain-containing domain, partial [Pleurocapsa sp.]